ETDLPKGAFSILPADRHTSDILITDDRLKLLSFTGSHEVGWDMKARAGRKKVVLELGGNAACVVDADADISKVVERLTFGAFYQSGQSCISVQRIYAHITLYDKLKERLIERTKNLEVGDPRDPATFIGPLIREAEAKRVEQWINDAVSNGATLLCGGERNGATITPALLENVADDSNLMQEEIFGPAAVLVPYEDFNDVLDAVNNTRFGLQAGIFTRDL